MSLKVYIALGLQSSRCVAKYEHIKTNIFRYEDISGITEDGVGYHFYDSRRKPTSCILRKALHVTLILVSLYGLSETSASNVIHLSTSDIYMCHVLKMAAVQTNILVSGEQCHIVR